MHVALSCCASSSRAEWVVHATGTDAAFSRGSNGRKCVNPWRDMRTEICLSATCRGVKGTVRQMQLVKVAPFTLGFPAEPRLLMQFGWQRPCCWALTSSPLQSLPPDCTHPGGRAQPRASRVGCDLCVRNAAYTTGWEGSWTPELLVPRPLWCSSKTRQFSTRAKAMN